MSITVAIDAHLAFGTSTGDSSYWTGLLYGLAQLDSDLRYLIFFNGELPKSIPECPRFTWQELKGSNSRYWSLVQFPMAARRAGADVLHTQYNVSPVCGGRAVTTIHDVSFFIGPQWFRPRDLFLLRRFIPASVKRAAAVLTVSETSRAEILSFLPAANGKTFSTPLATPVHIKATAQSALLDDLLLPEKFVLTVGTRWPRKNVQLAIDAAELANVPLVITGRVGWGPEELGSNTKSVGFVNDQTLSALYRRASIYLAPSHHEGFGLPLLEAFTCGCPVICSSGGAFPEVAGEAAIVMKSWQVEDWAETIKETLNSSSKLAEMREAGFRRAAQFSWKETARLTEDVYRFAAERIKL